MEIHWDDAEFMCDAIELPPWTPEQIEMQMRAIDAYDSEIAAKIIADMYKSR